LDGESVSSQVPQRELEGETGDQLPGMEERLLSQAVRKLTTTIGSSDCQVICINQIRRKIGVRFGSPETTSGGNALKFYASVRLDIRRIGSIKERDEFVGNRTRVKVVKNKLAPPFRTVEFDILFGRGVSKLGELLDLGMQSGLVEKSGSWLSYGGERLGQGRENARRFLAEHGDVAERLEGEIRSHARELEERMLSERMGGGKSAKAVAEAEAESEPAAGASADAGAAGDSDGAVAAVADSGSDSDGGKQTKKANPAS
ncbi:MAG: hypothetical protein MPK62_15370, partial [Alphaproteobacteria bacterium]|nr:hypothetical protein [Alphaproteobacteria bacterium]